MMERIGPTESLPWSDGLPTSPTRGTPWILALACVLPTIVTWVYFVLLAGRPSNTQQVAYLLGKVVQFALPIVWVVIAQGWRPWRLSRTPQSRSKAGGIAWGIAFGIAIAGAMGAIWWFALRAWPGYPDLVQRITQKIHDLGLQNPWAYAGLGLFYALAHSGAEEYYWRWFVFRQASVYLKWWHAAGLSSLGFMAHHVILLATFFGWHSPLTYVFSLGVALGGLIWCGMYALTGHLRGAWLSHLLIDAAIFALGYAMILDRV